MTTSTDVAVNFLTLAIIASADFGFLPAGTIVTACLCAGTYYLARAFRWL